MHDYTGNEIRDALSNIGISLGDTIYCHSNIGLFGYIENYQSKRQVCEQFYKAIFDIIGPKGTLIVPTYTTHIPSNDQVFDSNNTVSKMGVFAEWIRTHNNSIRSLDPFFSVAAIGADADYYCQNIPNNSFSKDSIFDQTLINNVKILCLNHPGCTFLHFVERELKIPYRFDKTFNCNQMINGNVVNQDWTIWVRYLSDEKLIHSPTKFVKFIKNESIAHFAKLGRGEILSISASKVFSSVKTGLKNDPWFLINADSNDISVRIDTSHK
jgi:aminoglycoside 3-N-acetyltransferase